MFEQRKRKQGKGKKKQPRKEKQSTPPVQSNERAKPASSQGFIPTPLAYGGWILNIDFEYLYPNTKNDLYVYNPSYAFKKHKGESLSDYVPKHRKCQ